MDTNQSLRGFVQVYHSLGWLALQLLQCFEKITGADSAMKRLLGKEEASGEPCPAPALLSCHRAGRWQLPPETQGLIRRLHAVSESHALK